MLQGIINLYGLAFLLSSVAAMLWLRRLQLPSSPTLNKDLWTKVLFYISIFVFFLGSTFWIDNPVWFRVTIIIGHIFIIPAQYYISKMWWRLLVKEMPKWWGLMIIGINLVFLSAEIYYSFLGYLPYSYLISDNVAVLIRNDHPVVAWLFIPAVWSSWWPMGYVFFRQSFLAKGLKLKARLFAFGATWILGSSMNVYSNFVADPQKILRSNIALIITFTALIFAIVLKPKQAAGQTEATPANNGSPL